MKELIKILHEGDYSCVVANFDEIYTFSQRGVADLYDMVKNKHEFLKGASIADKVVGKGAAALMIIGGIKELYTDLISLPALTLLREEGVKTDYAQVVPFILNRNESDWCPLEKICNDETSVNAILPLIEEFINRMKVSQMIELEDI